ncbi:MAG: SprT family zinc-dependent metalloprotease [Chloroflexota bacterium]
MEMIDEVIRSKRKSIAIIVERDGKVIVRAPVKTPERLILAFVISKKAWISEKKLFALSLPQVKKRSFANGESLPLFGKQLPLRVSTLPGSKKVIFQNDIFYLANKETDPVTHFEKWYKKKAQTYFQERVPQLAAVYGLQYEKIRLSSARTRWGSCSFRGTLSFNWKLIMAPIPVIEYVIIHELTHLKIKNHSKKFWDDVERKMPDYKQRRDWLKKNGRQLSLDGDQ